MVKNIVFRIVAGLVLLAAIAGIALFAYQAGTMHSVSANVQLPTEDGLRYYPHFWMFPFFGLGGFFSLLFGLFLLALAFGALRRLILGPRWYWRHMRYDPNGRGSMGRYGPWGEGIPPFFTEWHKRAHAEMDKAPEEEQK